MSRWPDPEKDIKRRPRRRGRVGAPEILTEELARRIARMVQNFPDAGIEVTWANVIDQSKRRFGHEFRRNVLAQKHWNGRRLIHEAFQESKAIQRRSLRDKAHKYAKEPRSRLRMIVSKLQAENLALRETLAQVRAAQYDEIFSLLETRTPLDRAVELRAQGNQVTHNSAEKSLNSSTIRRLEGARTEPEKEMQDNDDADYLRGD